MEIERRKVGWCQLLVVKLSKTFEYQQMQLLLTTRIIILVVQVLRILCHTTFDLSFMKVRWGYTCHCLSCLEVSKLGCFSGLCFSTLFETQINLGLILTIPYLYQKEIHTHFFVFVWACNYKTFNLHSFGHVCITSAKCKYCNKLGH